MKTFKEHYIEEMSAVDKLQASLDIAGLEPTVGTAADAANTVISGLRAALSREPDKRKQHIINAGISAISMIPFADVLKLLKLRKISKGATRTAISGVRKIKTFGKQQQMLNRFDSNAPNTPVVNKMSLTQEKSVHDPVRPGILKRQVKGKMTCSKARGIKSKQKNKGNNTAKAAQRFCNYRGCKC
jgi:hypothetical protein